MCNTYVQQPKPGAIAWQARVNKAVAELKRTLIRKSDPAVVVTLDGSDLAPATMRWGFLRHFNDSINNLRA